MNGVIWMKHRGDLCLILCGVLVWFLADAVRVRAAAAEALVFCGSAVIPALFPFLAVSGLLISLGFGEWLGPRLAGLMALYDLPGSAGSALVLGLAGGYPVGARTAADLYRKGALTRDEAERLLGFCNNSNPVFLISVLGAGVFGSLRVGVYLWLIHILSALLTGFFFRGRRAVHRAVPKTLPSKGFAAAFVEAVGNAGNSMVSICAFVVLFYVLASPLAALGWPAAALTGFLELFSLTPLLSPDRAGFLLAAVCSSFGGLSIRCQTAAALDSSGLSLKPCILGKCLQATFAAVLCGMLFLADTFLIP